MRGEIIDPKYLYSKLKELNPIYYIVYLGLVLRIPFLFHNYDSRVYYLWSKYFANTVLLPYYDHPPLVFILESSVIHLSKFLNYILTFNTLIYPFVFIPAAILVYKLFKRGNKQLCILILFVLAYSWVAAFFSKTYELLTIIPLSSGIIEIYLVYRLGEELFGEKVGVLSAFFISVSWWHIVYSRILLIDGIALTLTTWFFLEYVKFLDKKEIGIKNLFLPVLSGILCLFSKYYTLLIFIPLFAYICLKKKKLKEILLYLSPLIISFLALLSWLMVVGFDVMHYAGSHYYFNVLPSEFAFLTFFIRNLTPIFFGLFLFSFPVLLRERDKIEEKLLVFMSILTPLAVYMFFTYFKGLSHTLINLSNYMLFALPFILYAISSAWKYIEENFVDSKTILALIGITSLLLLMFNPVTVEYDKNYESVKGNLNTLNKSQLSAIEIPKEFKHHYVYRFHRHLSMLHDGVDKSTHFRWLSPSKMKILSLDSGFVNVSFDIVKLGRAERIKIKMDDNTLNEFKIPGKSKTINLSLKLGSNSHILTFKSVQVGESDYNGLQFAIKRH